MMPVDTGVDGSALCFLEKHRTSLKMIKCNTVNNYRVSTMDIVAYLLKSFPDVAREFDTWLTKLRLHLDLRLISANDWHCISD